MPLNRTLKEATVQRYHYGSHARLKAHIHAFLMAYNFARRLKTLKGLTPYEHVCKVWTTQPNRFRLNPLHHEQLGLLALCRIRTVQPVSSVCFRGQTRSLLADESHAPTHCKPPLAQLGFVVLISRTG